MEETKQLIVKYNNTDIICEGTELQMFEEMSLKNIDIVLNPNLYPTESCPSTTFHLIKLPIKSINGLLCECSLIFETYLGQRERKGNIYYRVFSK